MSDTRKRPSLGDFIVETRQTLRHVIFVMPRLWWKDARERMRDLPKSNYEMGLKFAQSGAWFDAIFRFRMALYMRPGYARAWFHLGCSYYRDGKAGHAVDALKRATAQDPNDQEAWFVLAAISPKSVPVEKLPTRMPPSMLQEYFASLAQGYDDREAQDGYVGPAQVAALAKPLVKNPNPFVVDVGCGSGLASRPWRATARRMVGVDVVPEMADLGRRATMENPDRIHSQQASLFEAVLTADIAAMPPGSPENEVDLVLMVNAAGYMGDLRHPLAAACAMLIPGGVLALTLDPTTAAPHYMLDAASWRFHYHIGAAQETAKAIGLTLVSEHSIELYTGTRTTLLLFTKG